MSKMLQTSEIERFRTEVLISHNQYRAQHGTAPLRLSFQLSDAAQSLAVKLAQSENLQFSSRSDVFNDSIAYTWGSQLTGTLVSRMWYEEGNNYDYQSRNLCKSTQHFTQLLWKGSQELGVGRARNKYGKEVIVVRYQPPGNIEKFIDNVACKTISLMNKTSVIDPISQNSYPGLRQFQEDCLAAHNRYRQRHGANSLQWSYKLTQEAQKWANHLLKTGTLTHSGNTSYGENLAGRRSYDLTGKKATKLWYDENKMFDYDAPKFSSETGNFTQLVWRSSHYFGVGKACSKDMCIVVAYYFPPGNVIDEFDENVGALEDNSPTGENEECMLGNSTVELGYFDLEKFQTEFMVFANYLRARHASPPLTTSHLLMANAQNWANNLLKSGKITYMNEDSFGESIAYSQREDLTAFKVCHLWYDEIQNHDFLSSSCNPESINFTQLIWHGTREVGIGKAVGRHGYSIVVAHYFPAGNIDGMVTENVAKLSNADVKEVHEVLKRSYTTKGKDSRMTSPPRTGETFVFRPPSGEFNQLVWIDRSATPLDLSKLHESNDISESKENMLNFESPPPSPSRALNQINELLKSSTNTCETGSSCEEDGNEELKSTDKEECIFLSKSTSREDVESDNGCLYQQLTRTFSNDAENDVDQNAHATYFEESSQGVPIFAKSSSEYEEETCQELEENFVMGTQDYVNKESGSYLLRSSKPYKRSHNEDFGEVKEISLIKQSETQESQDWGLLNNLLSNSRISAHVDFKEDEDLADHVEPGCVFLGQTKASSFDSENLTGEMEVEQMPVLEYALTQSKVKSCEETFSKNSLENVFSEMDDKGNDLQFTYAAKIRTDQFGKECNINKEKAVVISFDPQKSASNDTDDIEMVKKEQKCAQLETEDLSSQLSNDKYLNTVCKGNLEVVSYTSEMIQSDVNKKIKQEVTVYTPEKEMHKEELSHRDHFYDEKKTAKCNNDNEEIVLHEEFHDNYENASIHIENDDSQIVNDSKSHLLDDAKTTEGSKGAQTVTVDNDLEIKNKANFKCENETPKNTRKYSEMNDMGYEIKSDDSNRAILNEKFLTTDQDQMFQEKSLKF